MSKKKKDKKDKKKPLRRRASAKTLRERIARLEEEISVYRAHESRRVLALKKELERFERGDTLRKEGEHWYRLDEYFDGKERTKLVPEFPAYFLGMLNDIVVVEVPNGTEAKEIRAFVELLDRNGIKQVLTVQEGVKFLKLGAVDAELEAKIDAAEMRREVELAEPLATGSRPEPSTRYAVLRAELEAKIDAVEMRREAELEEPLATGSRPEPAGNGLGTSGPSEGNDHSGGSHSHQATDRA